MARKSRLPPPRGFRPSDWRQIVSMLGMLALLYLAWDWARQPSTWRWLAKDASTEDAGPGDPASAKAVAAQSPAAAATEPPVAAKGSEGKGSGAPQAPVGEPVASGPTDEDPEEQTGAQDEFQAITDKTLSVSPEEMFAYKRLVQWVVNQPLSMLRKRARADLTFHDFMTSPDKYRGALVELVLDARLIRNTEFRATNGRDLFEVWGFTADSGSWLYNAMVVGLPDGMPVGTRVNERVRFVGYFFKLQGYYEANAKPRSAPLIAPALIGRLIWIQAPPTPSTQGDASWMAFAFVGFGLVVCLYFVWRFVGSKQSRSSMRPIGRPKPGALTMDEWLEKAEEGDAPLEDPHAIARATPPDHPFSPSEPIAGSEDTPPRSGEPSSHPLDGGVGGGG